MRNLTPLLLALSLAGCGGGGGSSATPPAPSPTATADLGTVAIVGDSISAGCFEGTGWVLDLTCAWPTTAGQITGRPIVNASIYGGQVSTMIAYAMPLVPPTATTVVYAGGTNDIAQSGLSGSALTALIDQMVAAIKARAPHAKIIFLDARNPYSSGANDPTIFSGYSLPTEQLYANTTTWDNYEKSLGPTVDIEWEDPTSYDASGVQQWPDNVHPTPTEAHRIGTLMAPLVAAN